MTGQQGRDPAITASPARDLRQAVRPVAVAYTTLARQQKQASTLAKEAEQLVGATRDFLESAGLAHLLGPAPTEKSDCTDVTDNQAELLAAYANAGMQWASVMSAAVALGEALIADGEWDHARRLAAALDDAGETKAAEDLMTGLSESFTAEQRRRLSQINDSMTEAEITQALEIARDAWLGFRKYAPAKLSVMPHHLEEINASIAKFNYRDRSGRLNSSWQVYYRRLFWADSRAPRPDDVEKHLDGLTQIFDSYRKAKAERRKRRG